MPRRGLLPAGTFLDGLRREPVGQSWEGLPKVCALPAAQAVPTGKNSSGAPSAGSVRPEPVFQHQPLRPSRGGQAGAV